MLTEKQKLALEVLFSCCFWGDDSNGCIYLVDEIKMYCNELSTRSIPGIMSSIYRKYRNIIKHEWSENLGNIVIITNDNVKKIISDMNS